MKVVKDTIGNTSVFIQVTDEKLDIVDEIQTGRATQPTGIKEKLTDTYTQLKTVLRGIAEDISSEVKDIDSHKRPKELTIDFNLSLSGQAGIWIISGQGNGVLQVHMTWDLKNEQEPNQ